MKGTGAGWDSLFYRIFVVGGLAAVIAGVVFAAILSPPDSRLPLYIGYCGIAGFMALLLAYWWVQLAFKGYGSAVLPPGEEEHGVSNFQILKSWNSLFGAMVIHGGDREEMEKLQKQSKRPLLLWFGMAMGLALYILAFMGLYIAGILPLEKVRYFGMGVPVLAILMVAVSASLVGKANQANEPLIFAPLGLSPGSTPEAKIIPTAGRGARVSARGVVTLTGARFGRGILITIESGKTTTLIQEAVESFEIKSNEGKLEATAGAPKAVINALKGLRAAKRWEGISIRGGRDGAQAERRSRGRNMWLYDLWLIEHILESLP